MTIPFCAQVILRTPLKCVFFSFGFVFFLQSASNIQMLFTSNVHPQMISFHGLWVPKNRTRKFSKDFSKKQFDRFVARNLLFGGCLLASICFLKSGPYLICAFTPASALLTIKTTHMCRHELARSPGEEISRSWTTKVNNILRPAAGLQRDAAENKITTFSSQRHFLRGTEDIICVELLFSAC